MDQSASMEHTGEDEIDLRAYVRVILAQWKLILGLAIVAGALAAAVSLLLPPTYEAKAMVVVTKPQYLIDFDPRIKTVDGVSPPSKALIALATTDDVLTRLSESPALAAAGIVQSPADLKEMLAAQSTADPTVLALVAKAPEPRRAAVVANAWAEALVAHARTLYGQGAADVAYFETQLAEADASLAKAEASMVAFESRSELALREGDLESLRKERELYLSQQEAARRLGANAESLRRQLASQPADARVRTSDEITAWLIQIEAFGMERTGAAGAPIQLQIVGGQTLSETTVGDLQATLTNLQLNLEQKSASIAARLKDLDSRIPDLQRQVQDLTQQKARLGRSVEVARETYQTLSRKLDESRIAAQDTKGEIQVASQAIAPSKPSGSRPLLNTAAGCIVGAILGLVIVISREWWRDRATIDADASAMTGRFSPAHPTNGP